MRHLYFCILTYFKGKDSFITGSPLATKSSSLQTDECNFPVKVLFELKSEAPNLQPTHLE